MFAGIAASAQEDTAVAIIDDSETGQPTKVFYSQRLINANTVEVLSKGIMEFKVIHNFGDIAGDAGGIQRFFGLDNATDIKIAFHIGLSDKLNLIAARAKGADIVQQLWELGLKYQFMRQMDNDSKHPFSMTLYVNNVISSMKSSSFPGQENTFEGFSDRLSQLVQLMIARRFGGASFQLSPSYVHTNYVVNGDNNGIFALGAATRIPLTEKFFIIADYFKPFRDDESKNVIRSMTGRNPRDIFGVGVEMLTEGHVFHLNFTNATSIIENRFIPRTYAGWGDGEFRWGFTVSRRFVLFKDKKQSSNY